jgi:hypothetical protein
VTVSVHAECGVCGEEHGVEDVIYGICPEKTAVASTDSSRR